MLVILMGNRLSVFEGSLLPIAEVTLHFMGKRMVPFLALCRRGFFRTFLIMTITFHDFTSRIILFFQRIG